MQFPIEVESKKVNYHVEVTDSLGSIINHPILVNYFDISEALDTDLLTFTVPDPDSRNFSDLLIVDDPILQREDVIYLFNRTPGDRSDIYTVDQISTEIEGPVILSYDRIQLSSLRATLDGRPLDNQMIRNPNDAWTTVYASIEAPGKKIVSWSPGIFYGIDSFGYLDQVSVSQSPKIFVSPQNVNSVVGLIHTLKYEFISVGETTHQLTKGNEVIAETVNSRIGLQTLQSNQSGTFQLLISNEFGEEVSSEPFEIQIFDTIGEAVEQPDLTWTYEGENIWVPQSYETYDGEDAAALLDEGEGIGYVRTKVQGPALASFWHKGSYDFLVNGADTELNTSDTEWREANIALPKDTNFLMWSSGFFDRLKVEPVELIGNAVEQSDLEWVYEGNRIWIAQTEESYDGEDAAALLNGETGFGSVSTTIIGPALISFWWKDGSRFYSNKTFLEYEGEGWQQILTVVWEDENKLSWHSGFFDQLEIEDLRDYPFRRWAFGNFPLDDVVNNLEEVRNSDPDFDTFSNLVEWALNKNKDFPNKALAYEIIEDDGVKYLGLTFARLAELGEFSIHLEATTNLTTWERINPIVSETFNPSNNTYTVTIRDIQPLGTGGRFIRLIVTDE